MTCVALFSISFIDKTGKEVIPFIYHGAFDFSEGLALMINESDKIVYIDKTGKIVIPFIYGSEDNFKNGRTTVYEDVEHEENNNGIINTRKKNQIKKKRYK